MCTTLATIGGTISKRWSDRSCAFFDAKVAIRQLLSQRLWSGVGYYMAQEMTASSGRNGQARPATSANEDDAVG